MGENDILYGTVYRTIIDYYRCRCKGKPSQTSTLHRVTSLFPQQIPQPSALDGEPATNENITSIDDVLSAWQPGIFRELWIDMALERRRQRAEGAEQMCYFAEAQVLIPSEKLLVQIKTLGEGTYGKVLKVQETRSQASFAMKLAKPVSGLI